MKRILLTFFAYAVSVTIGRTTVSIKNVQWQINGEITYPGTAAEGLLLNVRMVCNEDDKISGEAVQALQTCVENGCSWGFMHKNLNQYQPFEFKGYDDDGKVYDKFKKVTTKQD